MVLGVLIFKHIRVQNCAFKFLKLNSVNLKTMEVSNKHCKTSYIFNNFIAVNMFRSFNP